MCGWELAPLCLLPQTFPALSLWEPISKLGFGPISGLGARPRPGALEAGGAMFQGQRGWFCRSVSQDLRQFWGRKVGGAQCVSPGSPPPPAGLGALALPGAHTCSCLHSGRRRDRQRCPGRRLPVQLRCLAPGHAEVPQGHPLEPRIGVAVQLSPLGNSKFAALVLRDAVLLSFLPPALAFCLSLRSLTESWF